MIAFVVSRFSRVLGSYGSPPQPQMNVSKSGACLPLFFCVVISVSLSTLITWTLKSIPIGFVISLTSLAIWMFSGDSERTARLNESFTLPLARMPSPPGL